MNNRIQIGPRPITPGGQTVPAQVKQPQAPVAPQSFSELLDTALTQPVKFSGHALERMAASGRKLNETQLKDLANAVDRAAQKGSRDALVLMQDLALVVSVKNRTVITAVDGQRVKDNIFTNIDSAVII